MYLIDANVLITAKNLYYPLDRIPQFWEWLIDMGEAGNIKMPREIHDEICERDNPLGDWARDDHTKEALLLLEDPDPALVQRVVQHGYEGDHPDFTDGQLENIGRDAFIVSYGLADTSRVIVTKEVSAPKKRMGNRKIPDACNDCGVNWCTDWDMYSALDFNLRR
ncbi:DUF4411 family protein [Roseovarius sp. A21]|uniref:DUF4411 family protein n=1 Tax=Roseovarius bejariae TaxID=2576383 RepID=A0A844CXG7_9RHOB|nr:DUF4411 family protein [Roseovarius bejariae]MRU15816.1 DUF4411 family protein [Roseovarius bejariae]